MRHAAFRAQFWRGKVFIPDPSKSRFYNRNVYKLYDCAAEFMEDLEESTSYEYADDAHHTKTVKGGSYCCSCYGTHHTEKSSLERHDLQREIVPELAHQRFVVKDTCTLCS